MATTYWDCLKCTYRHESNKESRYLSCAVCAEPKSTTNTNQRFSKKLAPTKPPQAVTKNNNNKRKQQNGTILQHFGSTTNEILSPKRQRVTEKNSSTNSVTEAPPQKSMSLPQTPTKLQQQTQPRRTILDALKPCRASSFVPPARYRDSPKEAWRIIENYEDIPKLCPMTIAKDVLPNKVATTLLQQLETESTSWNRGNWITYGNEHPIPRTTATYNLTLDSTKDGPSRYGSENAQHDKSIQSSYNNVEDDEEEEYLDQNQQRRMISSELRQAANCISELVQQHCPWAMVNENEGWEPTFAFASRYSNGQECVGWHADHITPLGPRPIIVGLSLGSCRRFELRQMPSNSKSTAKEDSSDPTTPAAAIPWQRHVSVSLPHNSVCIMWNDAQESWQHSVPRCSDESIVANPIVGSVRISLTFRKRRPNIPDLGNCHCGRPAGLKAKDGKYYLFCRPYGKDKQGKTCMFWKPCHWAEQEAKRLIRLENEAN